MKLLPIDDCDDCTKIYFDNRLPFCDVKKRRICYGISDAIPIPDWCPLEDVFFEIPGRIKCRPVLKRVDTPPEEEG